MAIEQSDTHGDSSGEHGLQGAEAPASQLLNANKVELIAIKAQELLEHMGQLYRVRGMHKGAERVLNVCVGRMIAAYCMACDRMYCGKSQQLLAYTPKQSVHTNSPKGTLHHHIPHANESWRINQIREKAIVTALPGGALSSLHPAHLWPAGALHHEATNHLPADQRTQLGATRQRVQQRLVVTVADLSQDVALGWHKERHFPYELRVSIL